MDSELTDRVLLRADIEVNLHQLEHLQRSQSELRAALVDTPEDEDFKQAYNENTTVISNKIDKLRILKQQLEAIDVSFQREQRFLNRLNSAMSNLSSLTLTTGIIQISEDIESEIPQLMMSTSTSSHVGAVEVSHTIPEEGIYL